MAHSADFFIESPSAPVVQSFLRNLSRVSMAQVVLCFWGSASWRRQPFALTLPSAAVLVQTLPRRAEPSGRGVSHPPARTDSPCLERSVCDLSPAPSRAFSQVLRVSFVSRALWQALWQVPVALRAASRPLPPPAGRIQALWLCFLRVGTRRLRGAGSLPRGT